MSGEEELGLIEAAAYRYARKHGATDREAEKISRHTLKRLRKATEYEIDHAGFGRVVS